MARVVLTADAKEDLRDFDSATRTQIVKGLRKLETEPEKRGQPLSKELAGYRKLVVGKQEIRIVYSVEDDGSACVAWIIAQRSNDHVYALARARLVEVPDVELRSMLDDILAQAKSL